MSKWLRNSAPAKKVVRRLLGENRHHWSYPTLHSEYCPVKQDVAPGSIVIKLFIGWNQLLIGFEACAADTNLCQLLKIWSNPKYRESHGPKDRNYGWCFTKCSNCILNSIYIHRSASHSAFVKKLLMAMSSGKQGGSELFQLLKTSDFECNIFIKPS